ncbi:MAG: hypothetical protein GX776_05825 [Oxalobacter sp.]|nr:hypothetical protein [Oxalobacter sp.]
MRQIKVAWEKAQGYICASAAARSREKRGLPTFGNPTGSSRFRIYKLFFKKDSSKAW